MRIIYTRTTPSLHRLLILRSDSQDRAIWADGPPLYPANNISQSLVSLETVVVHDVLSSLSNRLHLPQRARLASLHKLRVHSDDIAALVFLSRHQQLHGWLNGEVVRRRRRLDEIFMRCRSMSFVTATINGSGTNDTMGTTGSSDWKPLVCLSI